MIIITAMTIIMITVTHIRTRQAGLPATPWFRNGTRRPFRNMHFTHMSERR